jgi:hypothetical protein
MNDDFLNQFRKPPRREFAAELYQRISNPMKTNLRTPAWRYAALALTFGAVITAILFFSPATRALADTVMRQFGAYIFVQGTPVPLKIDIAEKKQMDVASRPNRDGDYSFASDATAASQLVGFTVIPPSYVPEGFTPATIDNVTGGWRVTRRWGGEAALTNYENPADESFLIIEELKIGQDRPNTVGRPQIVAVTVRGLPGVWLPDGDDGKNSLTWDENGITYSVLSNKLAFAEMQKIAESLGK